MFPSNQEHTKASDGTTLQNVIPSLAFVCSWLLGNRDAFIGY